MSYKHDHAISPERKKKWAEKDQGFFHAEDGEVIATGDILVRKSKYGTRAPFRVGAIVSSSNGLHTIAYMVGVRTGLYLGNTGPLGEYRKV